MTEKTWISDLSIGTAVTIAVLAVGSAIGLYEKVYGNSLRYTETIGQLQEDHLKSTAVLEAAIAIKTSEIKLLIAVTDRHEKLLEKARYSPNDAERDFKNNLSPIATQLQAHAEKLQDRSDWMDRQEESTKSLGDNLLFVKFTLGVISLVLFIQLCFITFLFWRKQ